MLDPLADKILTCAAFVCLVEIDAPGLPPGQHNLVQAWMAVIIIGREFVINGLRLMAAQKGVTLPADLLGKQKTISQMVSINFILLALALIEDWPHALGSYMELFQRWFPPIAFWLMMLTVLLTVISGVSYLIRGHRLYTHDA